MTAHLNKGYPLYVHFCSSLFIMSLTYCTLQAARVCYQLEQKHKRLLLATVTDLKTKLFNQVENEVMRRFTAYSNAPLNAPLVRKKVALERLDGICRRMTQQKVSNCFHSWRRHASRQKHRMRASQDKNICKIIITRNYKLLRYVFNAWRGAMCPAKSQTHKIHPFEKSLTALEHILCKQSTLNLSRAFQLWKCNATVAKRTSYAIPTKSSITPTRKEFRNGALNDIQSLQESLALEREAHAETITQLQDLLVSDKKNGNDTNLSESYYLIRQECESLRAQLTASVRQRSKLKQQIVKSKLQRTIAANQTE